MTLRQEKENFFLPQKFVGRSNSFHRKKKNDQDIINDAARGVGLLGDKNRKPRGPTRERKFRKEQWTDLYKQKSDEEFSDKTRINRTTFNLLLNTLWDGLVLTPTNFVPEPTSQTVGSIAL